MIVKKNKNTISADLEKSTVLLNLDSGEYMQLNESGKEIWELLDNMTSIQDLIQKLAHIYSVDKKIIEEDVMTFIKNAEKNNLLCVHD